MAEAISLAKAMSSIRSELHERAPDPMKRMLDDELTPAYITFISTAVVGMYKQAFDDDVASNKWEDIAGGGTDGAMWYAAAANADIIGDCVTAAGDTIFTYSPEQRKKMLDELVSKHSQMVKAAKFYDVVSGPTKTAIDLGEKLFRMARAAHYGGILAYVAANTD
eukprot:6633143-Pyramimonas_sp.AAC.1